MKVKKNQKYEALLPNPCYRKDAENNDNEVKQEEGATDTENVIKGKRVRLPKDTNFNHIKCKVVRHMKAEKLKREKAKAKKLARKERKDEGAPKQVPHTIESLREKDETTIQGDLEAEDNAEIKAELDHDEFAAYYKQDYEPKVLITYSDNPVKKTRIFGRELTRIIPNSISLYRNRSGVKKMVKAAIAKGFTDLIVVNENQCQPSILFNVWLFLLNIKNNIF